MTKGEMLVLLDDGQKITHSSFTSDEWMVKDIGMLFFEDGCNCHFNTFWLDRDGEEWDNGWSVFNS